MAGGCVSDSEPRTSPELHIIAKTSHRDRHPSCFLYTKVLSSWTSPPPSHIAERARQAGTAVASETKAWKVKRPAKRDGDPCRGLRLLAFSGKSRHTATTTTTPPPRRLASFFHPLVLIWRPPRIPPALLVACHSGHASTLPRLLHSLGNILLKSDLLEPPRTSPIDINGFHWLSHRPPCTVSSLAVHPARSGDCRIGHLRRSQQRA